jgi:integrase
MQVFLVIAYETGARRSEILGENRRSKQKKEPLRWDQVDWGGRVIRFEKTKNGETRVAPFTGELEQWLRAAHDDHLRNWPDCPWVVHSGGAPVYDPRKTWNKARRAAGVRVTMHDFRRTHVTDLDRAGVSRKVAMGIVGHKSEKTHLGYEQVRPRDLEQAARTIEAYRQQRESAKEKEPEGVVQ